jgi:transposase
MEADKILMNRGQLQTFQVMGLVGAAGKIGVSYGQAKRIRKRVKEKGAKGPIHGNVVRSPQNRVQDEVREKVLDLSRNGYFEFNDTHFTEKLWEEEGIKVSRGAVRKLRREAGVMPKRKRRAKRHRGCRERKAQEELMVLWDGSLHPWFGPSHPPCCLMAAMDDAQGAILAARFFLFKGPAGYLWLLRELAHQYGIPVSIYQDCHGALRRNDGHWTLDEQPAGRQEPT